MIRSRNSLFFVRLLHNKIKKKKNSVEDFSKKLVGYKIRKYCSRRSITVLGTVHYQIFIDRKYASVIYYYIVLPPTFGTFSILLRRNVFYFLLQ